MAMDHKHLQPYISSERRPESSFDSSQIHTYDKSNFLYISGYSHFILEVNNGYLSDACVLKGVDLLQEDFKCKAVKIFPNSVYTLTKTHDQHSIITEDVIEFDCEGICQFFRFLKPEHFNRLERRDIIYIIETLVRLEFRDNAGNLFSGSQEFYSFAYVE